MEELPHASYRTIWTFGHQCVLQHSRVPRGTLNQTLRSAQRRLLNDFMPSKFAKETPYMSP